ncbi:MAG: imelysin family protein [Myxococcales bacterium]
MHFRTLTLSCASLALLAACGDGEDSSKFPAVQAEQAIANYKQLVNANYTDVVTTAQKLKVAIDAFLAAPSAETQQAAKDAWIAARLPYGPSENLSLLRGPHRQLRDGTRRRDQRVAAR